MIHSLPKQLFIYNYKTTDKGIIKYIADKTQFDETDIEAVRNILNQPEVLKAFRKGKTDLEFDQEETRNFLNWLKRMSGEDKQHTFFVYTSDNRFIGSIEFQKVENNTATVGFWADNNRSGFMTNAITALIPVARKEFKLKEFNSYAVLDNTKSQRLLKRIGFIEEKIVINPRGVRLIKFLLKENQ